MRSMKELPKTRVNSNDLVVRPEGLVADPDKPAYSEDGVDLTLIRWTLSMTPAERLQAVQSLADCIEKMRRASQTAKLFGDNEGPC